MDVVLYIIGGRNGDD